MTRRSADGGFGRHLPPDLSRLTLKFVATLATRCLCAAFRRRPFRGLGRLRPFLPVPDEGTATVRFGGMRLSLDLREEHQRNMYFGLYDRTELHVVTHTLAGGGDAVDVGAHIGFYTVAAALAGGGRGGRVLAFEPHPGARAQLEENLRLNGVVERVEVLPDAVGAEPGSAVLHVPSTPDSSWSSLRPRPFEEGEPIAVKVTTLDAAVGTRGLHPVFVKIDVEGLELAVLEGMAIVLSDNRPMLLCEVSEATASSAWERVRPLGYEQLRVTARGLEPGSGDASGIFNVLFVPAERLNEVRRWPAWSRTGPRGVFLRLRVTPSSLRL